MRELSITENDQIAGGVLCPYINFSSMATMFGLAGGVGATAGYAAGAAVANAAALSVAGATGIAMGLVNFGVLLGDVFGMCRGYTNY